MRIALLVHAFPPRSQTGVEVYTESLARAFAAGGHVVEVLAASRERDRLHLAQEREQRAGYGVTWLTLSAEHDEEERRRLAPGSAAAVGRFLDRERPDVLHLQHMLGFDPALIDEARKRDIPVLFTAHDGFAVCDEYTFVAPDLTPVDALDLTAQAGCRLARGVLDGALEEHDGYLVPEFAEAGLLREVRAALSATGVEVEQHAARIEQDVRARLEALSRADHVQAPTRFLAQELQRAGLAGDVHVRACGIDASELAVSRAAHDGPLRVLYLGGYFEHKGVHVLMEAASRCGLEVQLSLRGCAGSSDYVSHLQRLAGDGAAQLDGPFERRELAALLAGADVLALPSLWPENAPFVLREAFAAGCPVLVSDTPALRESVRDGVDGLCIAMGDVAAWSAALAGLAGNREQLAQLAAGVRAPKTIAQDAREALAIYAELVAARDVAAARRRTRLPGHLQPFAARHAALEQLSIRELTERGIAGLQRLAQDEGIALPQLQGAAALLANGQRLRERLAAAARSESWRAEIAADRERASQSAVARAAELEQRARSESERAAWQEQLREEREQRLAWVEEQLAAQQRALAALRAESQLARDTAAEFSSRVEAAERELAASRAELEWRASQAVAARGELDWTRKQLADRARHIDELQAQAQAAEAERESLRAQLEDWSRRIEAGQAQLAESRGQMDRLASELAGLRESHGALEVDRGAAAAHQTFLEAQLDGAARREHGLESQLDALGQELRWRQGEMRVARQQSEALASRLFGGKLAKRARDWPAEKDAEDA